MEAMEERRVWQRVRGETGADRVETLRTCIARQGELLHCYRRLSRRGGRAMGLFEQKRDQLDCLRGLLRVLTGQSIAVPRGGDGPVELLSCHRSEMEFLAQLTDLSRDGEYGPIFDALLQRQKRQCRLLLELIGTM